MPCSSPASPAWPNFTHDPARTESLLAAFSGRLGAIRGLHAALSAGERRDTFLRAITPVMQQIGGDGTDWLALCGERGDDLLTAVSIAVGKPRAWVDALDADQAILLAAKVLEVNADFFTRTVMPRLDGLIAQKGAAVAVATAGSTPSST